MAILSKSFRSSVVFVLGCRDEKEVFCVCRDVNAGKDKQIKFRGVAQPGSAHRSGRWGRRFKSFRPDHFLFFLPLPKGFLKVTGSRCLPSRGRGHCPAVFFGGLEHESRLHRPGDGLCDRDGTGSGSRISGLRSTFRKTDAPVRICREPPRRFGLPGSDRFRIGSGQPCQIGKKRPSCLRSLGCRTKKTVIRSSPQRSL
jgi:hypothetical protein